MVILLQEGVGERGVVGGGGRRVVAVYETACFADGHQRRHHAHGGGLQAVAVHQ